MIKRKLLFKKRKKIKDKKTIGVLGIHHGAGATYTSLLIAIYMSEYLVKRTAFIECNNHKDMEIIESLYQWKRVNEKCFTYNLLDCYKSLDKGKMKNLLKSHYDSFIIDFGCDLSDNLDQFLQCDIKLVLCSHGMLKKIKLNEFIRSYSHQYDSESWIYLIPYGDNKKIIKHGRELERKTYRIPFEEEPTQLSKKTLKMFNELFAINE